MSVPCNDATCGDGYVSDGKGNCVREVNLDEISNCNELSSSSKEKLSNVLSTYKANCANLQVYQYIVDANKELCFKIDSDLRSQGGYNYTNSDIIFKSSSTINSTSLGEELFHGYQDLFYNGLGKYSNQGRSNIEFQSKLFHDMTNGGECCITFGGVGSIGSEYFIWLSEVTNNFTQLPKWSDISNKYFEFLEAFVDNNSNYNYPIDYNLIPNALLNLNDC